MTEPPDRTKRPPGVTKVFGVRREDELVPGVGVGPGAVSREADLTLKRRVVFGAGHAAKSAFDHAKGVAPRTVAAPENGDGDLVLQAFRPGESGDVPEIEEEMPDMGDDAPEVEETATPDVVEVREEDILAEVEDWGFTTETDPLEGDPAEELQYLLEQKVEEFQLLGYGSMTADDLWAYFQGLKKNRPRQLHELVGAILSLRPQAYMNESLKRAYQAPPLRLEDFRIEDFL